MALTDSLVSYWKLDSNGNDAHGSNNFTPTSVTWDTSVFKLGTASALLGTGSSLSAADSASLDVGNISIALWVNTSDTGSNLSFVTRYADASNRSIRMYLTSGQVHGFLYDTSNNNSDDFGNTTSIANGAWRHIVITADGSNIRYYLDGSLQKTTAWAQTLANAINAPFVIGQGNPIETAVFDGNVDEVGYWNRALLGAEVTELYNGGAGLAYPFGAVGGATPPISTLSMLGVG